MRRHSVQILVLSLLVLLSACGGDDESMILDELGANPLANPTVTFDGETTTSAISGDISTGIFVDANNRHSVHTLYSGLSEEDQELLVTELIAEAEWVGYDVRLVSDERGLPYGTYAAPEIEAFPGVLMILVTPSQVSIELSTSRTTR